MKTLNNTAHKILDAAEHFTQTRGFNAFSYKDIQIDVGVKTSSIHYYFPTKQDLASVMAERYVKRFTELLNDIDGRSINCLEKLKAMAGPFFQAAEENKFCLCGMLTSEISAMPEDAINVLRSFFEKSEHWLANTLQKGVEIGELSDQIDVRVTAAHLLAVLEGGLLISRTRTDPNYLRLVFNEALSQLKS